MIWLIVLCLAIVAAGVGAFLLVAAPMKRQEEEARRAEAERERRIAGLIERVENLEAIVTSRPLGTDWGAAEAVPAEELTTPSPDPPPLASGSEPRAGSETGLSPRERARRMARRTSV